MKDEPTWPTSFGTRERLPIVKLCSYLHQALRETEPRLRGDIVAGWPRWVPQLEAWTITFVLDEELSDPIAVLKIKEDGSVAGKFFDLEGEVVARMERASPYSPAELKQAKVDDDRAGPELCCGFRQLIEWRKDIATHLLKRLTESKA